MLKNDVYSIDTTQLVSRFSGSAGYLFRLTILRTQSARLFLLPAQTYLNA